jgi:hypothetical protein
MPFNPLERAFSWKHLTATNQVSSKSGMLHTITINRGDPAAASIATVYDGIGVTADIIAIIILDTALYTVPTTLVFDCGYLTGLYITFSAVTLADITVSYK